MGIVITCFIYFIYLFIGYAQDTNDSLGLMIFFFILGTIVSLFAGFLAASFIGCFFPQSKESTPRETFDLGNLERSSSTQGSFFLGCGSIDKVQHYFFYKKNAQGGYVPDNIPVDENVTFFEIEDDQTGPHVNIHTIMFKWNWVMLIGVPTTSSAYEFYIPKGSIKADYKL